MHERPDLRAFPSMTRWFNPVLLCKLLLRVIVSGLFGQYADRRLIIAALDTVSPETHLARADIRSVLQPEPDGAVWLDYVSDLGDGFDATYAIAYFLAQPSLETAAGTLPRGRLLIMGGDQVYPTSSLTDYKARLREPYALAHPSHAEKPRPLVYMVPGNHDWYDGLTAFLALFCREKPSRLGHWRTRQRRSYFVLKLTEDWWVWAIDIALTEDMDQPQAEYFVAMARQMPDNAKVILCTAEPGWYEGDRKAAAYRCLVYAARLAHDATSAADPARSKNLRVVACLSGDTHHYARYEGSFATQFVTSGGGGAFLHGTQSLKPTISIGWLKDRLETLRLVACYPSVERSHELLAGNARFALTNADFSIVLGFVYWVLGYCLAIRFRPDSVLITGAILAAGFCAYAAHQAKDRTGRAIGFALLHAACHWLAILGTAALALRLAGLGLGDAEYGWRTLFGMMIPGLASGWLVGGTLFGLNLWLTARYADMNHNDAFSAMRLDGYRHFLRIRICGDTLTIYPLGLDRVPSRSELTPTPDAEAGPGVSLFRPPPGTAMRLIEDPIVIRAGDVPAVAGMVDPQALGAATPGEAPPDAH